MNESRHIIAREPIQVPLSNVVTNIVYENNLHPLTTNHTAAEGVATNCHQSPLQYFSRVTWTSLIPA